MVGIARLDGISAGNGSRTADPPRRYDLEKWSRTALLKASGCSQ